MYFRLLFIVTCFLPLILSAQPAYHVIPAQEIRPYQLLGDSRPLKLKMGPFEISEQITYADYKKYLAAILRDSTIAFYSSQLPDSSIATKEVYEKYTTGNAYDGFPVLGISWEAAMNYCKWKTMEENPEGISVLYRLPMTSEWLAANHYLNKEKIDNDFNMHYSDWLINMNIEGVFGLDSTFYHDVTFFHKKSDRPGLKRKKTIGACYLYRMKDLNDYLRYMYFADTGYRQISFRIVRIRNNKEGSGLSSLPVLEYWELNKALNNIQ